LNHQIFLVTDVEFVQQATALLNYPIYFFPCITSTKIFFEEDILECSFGLQGIGENRLVSRLSRDGKTLSLLPYRADTWNSVALRQPTARGLSVYRSVLNNFAAGSLLMRSVFQPCWLQRRAAGGRRQE